MTDANTRCRRVAPAEAEAIASALAALHEDAFRAGMALGTLESIGRDGLEWSYREAVAGLDDRDRALLVAEQDGEILAMAQLTRSGALNAGHRAEVQRVAVADAARGRGVGRELWPASRRPPASSASRSSGSRRTRAATRVPSTRRSAIRSWE